MSLASQVNLLAQSVGAQIKALKAQLVAARLSAAVTNSTVTYATAMSVSVTAGGVYAFTARGQYRTAAITTGAGFRIGGTATATGIRYETTIYGLTATTYTHQTASTLNAAQPASTGVAAANTDYQFVIDGEIRVLAAGTLTVDFASEVAASLVTVQPDSTLVLTKIA
jgi:hypothetical protein